MTKLLTFKNYEIIIVANTLGNFDLKNKGSRGRNKLIKRLAEKAKEYNNDLEDIKKPYYKKNKKGEMIVKDNKYIPLDGANLEKLKEEIKEYNDETVSINFTEYSEQYKALWKQLGVYEKELKGVEAEVYDIVLDQLDAAFENDKEKEGK
ncbi:MAG: DUF1617 family protein [Liquorilactobacillus nagelii]|uniref:DUF1617 family protein n=1 Tax=Liquorilactobacillus nagelii TaxID=82688 RepID=UPI0039E7FBB5